VKIALCGPPQSGKSVLRERLKRAIRALAPDVYPYVLTTNPDGEGSWFQETYHHDPELANQLKAAAKQKWTPARAELYASWVRNTTVPLTFLDLGGIADDYNRQICRAATHAILLAPTEEQWVRWREFGAGCGLVILAELISGHDEVEDSIQCAGDPFRAAIHRLERGDLETPRPAVEALADYILNKV
jgi:CRISPR-associated protein Csx3